MKPFGTILVPVDFSAYTSSIIELAADLSRRYEAPLLLLHAYEPLTYLMPEGLVELDPHQLDRALARLSGALADVAKEARDAGAVSVESQVVHAHAIQSIVRAAQERKCSLIVMGTHGRTGFKHLLIGSVAENVVRIAPCPVLTVRGQAT